MYEELSYGDNLVGTAHPRIMTVSEEAMTAKEMRLASKRLDRLVATESQQGLIETLIEIGDYRPEKANQNATAETPVLKTDGKVVPMPRNRGY